MELNGIKDWIASHFDGQLELLKTLAEMYMEPTLTLMGTENAEEDSLDPTWTVEE